MDEARNTSEEQKAIDELRKACGTLPNRKEEMSGEVYYGCEKLEVELIDQPVNPYKALFAMATATWGDDHYKNKWKKVSPFSRYLVVLSALKGKTLPTAVESPKYTFLVRGTPRHCFDQMARTRVGAGFGSIGCRDNSKLDTSYILYSEYENMDEELKEMVSTYLQLGKELYGAIIGRGRESYQVARSVLPMCYHHPFVFTQNLLSLIQQARRRMCFGEEEFICGLHWFIRDIFIRKGFFLIADVMRPACDYAKKCLYSKGDGSELFSNLFAGCGRWPSEIKYAEFNKSCTDINSLRAKLEIIISDSHDYTNFTLNGKGFNSIGSGDYRLLNEE